MVSGGSEANESAFKLAREYHRETGNPEKRIVVGRRLSYHGNTLGTLGAGGMGTVYRVRDRELDEIVARRMSASTIGFLSKAQKKVDKHDPAIFQHVEPDDLLRFGLIPELIGRMPVMTALNALSDSAMKRILTAPKNALVKQYQKLFAMDGVDLTFEEAALDVIVEKARLLGTGARGLRAVMEEMMLDIMFDLHSTPNVSTCHITEATVRHGAEPIFEERKASA